MSETFLASLGEVTDEELLEFFLINGILYGVSIGLVSVLLSPFVKVEYVDWLPERLRLIDPYSRFSIGFVVTVLFTTAFYLLESSREIEERFNVDLSEKSETGKESVGKKRRPRDLWDAYATDVFDCPECGSEVQGRIARHGCPNCERQFSTDELAQAYDPETNSFEFDSHTAGDDGD